MSNLISALKHLEKERTLLQWAIQKFPKILTLNVPHKNVLKPLLQCTVRKFPKISTFNVSNESSLKILFQCTISFLKLPTWMNHIKISKNGLIECTCWKLSKIPSLNVPHESLSKFQMPHERNLFTHKKITLIFFPSWFTDMYQKSVVESPCCAVSWLQFAPMTVKNLQSRESLMVIIVRVNSISVAPSEIFK